MFHVKHPIHLNDLFGFLKAYNYTISKKQGDLFHTYIDLIRNWSRCYHLISRNDLTDIVERHILPCVFLYHLMVKRNKASLIDIGSGAGFPGIVLKIMQPDLKVVLIDSARKKYLFLKEVVEILKIDCDVISQRVEHYGLNANRKFDIVVNRAVASLEILWKWALPIIKSDGIFYAMKGGDCRDELNKLNNEDVKIEIIHPMKEWIQFSDLLREKVIIQLSQLPSDNNSSLV